MFLRSRFNQSRFNQPSNGGVAELTVSHQIISSAGTSTVPAVFAGSTMVVRKTSNAAGTRTTATYRATSAVNKTHSTTTASGVRTGPQLTGTSSVITTHKTISSTGLYGQVFAGQASGSIRKTVASTGTHAVGEYGLFTYEASVYVSI